MKFILTVSVLVVVFAGTLLAQSSKYLNQKLPGLVPEVFAPATVSLKDHYEYGSVFSKNGEEFYYAVIINKKPQIRRSRLEKEGWTKPEIIIASDKYEYNDPFLSPDGKRLFFISDRAVDGAGRKEGF
jgi:hypothetical protein